MIQKFSRNNIEEEKFFSVWEATLQGTFDDLALYFAGAYSSRALGGALWEASAVDVWGIIEKTFFVKIFNELIEAGYKAGTVDTYCRILYALFGDSTIIEVIINGPMDITINVDAEYSNFAQFITSSGGPMITAGGFPLVFTTLLNDISQSQILALLQNIKNTGTKLNFNLNS